MKKAISYLLSTFMVCPLWAEQISYQDLYISYVSAPGARAIADYVQKRQLAGIILWEIRGDTALSNSDSLLGSINGVMSNYTIDGQKPFIMGYWSNWNVYSMNAATRAIPEPAYAIPGSLDIHQTRVINPDLTEKLDALNAITYDFLEAETQTVTYYDSATNQTYSIANKTPEAIGTLYFNDPWADLSKPGESPVQDAFCKNNAATCNFALSNRTTPIDLKDGTLMGNFNAFARLQRKSSSTLEPVTNTTGNPLGPLRKLISVGGYGHDNSFEDTFNTPNGIQNFVDSAKAILNAYALDGIDLDYENPQMTAQNAASFVDLVKRLKAAMPDKIISVTILSDPAYLKGVREKQYGFANDTLREIARSATYINLMTYDFYGAFNYDVNGQGKTAFLTNLILPALAPANYPFSIEQSINAALNQGVVSTKISVGVPAYGRSLAGIAAENGGLFNPIPHTATIPRGDLDSKQCSMAISPLGPNSCNGSFQYKFILNSMLGHGLTEKNHIEGGVVIGTTAYGKSWTPPSTKGYKLAISNSGQTGDLAFNVIVGNFMVPDFFNPGVTKTYDSQMTNSIYGQAGLTISWTTSWGPIGQCPTPLNFNANSHITIRVTPDPINGRYLTSCILTQEPASI